MLERFKPEVLLDLRRRLSAAEHSLDVIDCPSASRASEVGRLFMRSAWLALRGDVLRGLGATWE